jgi:hypothetical protein
LSNARISQESNDAKRVVKFLNSGDGVRAFAGL